MNANACCSWQINSTKEHTKTYKTKIYTKFIPIAAIAKNSIKISTRKCHCELHPFPWSTRKISVWRTPDMVPKTNTHTHTQTQVMRTVDNQMSISPSSGSLSNNRVRISCHGKIYQNMLIYIILRNDDLWWFDDLCQPMCQFSWKIWVRPKFDLSVAIYNTLD